MVDEPKGKWGWMVAGVVALLGVLSAVGLSLPEVATKHDMILHQQQDQITIAQIKIEIQKLDRSLKLQQLESDELRALRLQREIDERRSKGETTEVLDTEIRILKRRVRSIQLQIDEAEKAKD